MEELKLRLKPHVKPQDLIPFGYTMNYLPSATPDKYNSKKIIRSVTKTVSEESDEIYISFGSPIGYYGEPMCRELIWNSFDYKPRSLIKHYIQDLIQAGMVE